MPGVCSAMCWWSRSVGCGRRIINWFTGQIEANLNSNGWVGSWKGIYYVGKPSPFYVYYVWCCVLFGQIDSVQLCVIDLTDLFMLAIEIDLLILVEILLFWSMDDQSKWAENLAFPFLFWAENLLNLKSPSSIIQLIKLLKSCLNCSKVHFRSNKDT